MAGITPISGPGLAGASQSVHPTGGEKAQGKSSFGEVLQQCVGQIDGDQQASSTAIQNLLTGRTQDVMPVVTAVAKADLSFKLLLGVRNKVVEAYKQTMNMQI